MRVIYKYPLTWDNTQILKLPAGSQIVSVQPQNGKITVWASVDTSVKELAEYRIKVYMTGQRIEDASLIFLNTCVIGDFVFHVCIVPEE